MAGGVSLSLSDCRSVPGKKMGTPHQQLQNMQSGDSGAPPTFFLMTMTCSGGMYSKGNTKRQLKLPSPSMER